MGGVDALRYLFFYQNYTGAPFHWPFDHIWSLCVEEHFYILLPLLFLFVKSLFKNNRSFLILAVSGLILTGIVFKFFSVRYTPGIDTYSTTHNRIDALGWGVLLGILVNYYEESLRKIKWLKMLFFLGVLLFAVSIFALIQLKSLYFEKAIFFTLSPFCFFLMLFGLYYHDFSKWKPLRFVAYYSYNWYLWHPVFVLIVGKYFGINALGLLIYMVASFLMAMIFTIFIEEKFLAIRERVISRIFKRTIRAAA